jgi:hypothetical protein
MKYPEGSIQNIFYNPANPKEACLEPIQEGGGKIELASGFLGIVIGILLLIGLF